MGMDEAAVAERLGESQRVRWAYTIHSVMRGWEKGSAAHESVRLSSNLQIDMFRGCPKIRKTQTKLFCYTYVDL